LSKKSPQIIKINQSNCYQWSFKMWLWCPFFRSSLSSRCWRFVKDSTL